MKNLFKTVMLLLAGILFVAVSCAQANRPDSNFGGLQVGVITYSYRSMPDQSIPAYINYIVESGVNSIELMGGPVEAYAGIPDTKDAAALKAWRLSVSMDKFREIRRLFDEAGIRINILKLGNPQWSDEEIDYAFEVCKIMGAQGISMEIAAATARRMAPFADKHKLYVIMHNHAQPGKEPGFQFENFLTYSPYLMLNFDAGHYFGATGKNPIEVLDRLHDRIVSVHIKDKTAIDATDPDKNRPFGEGNTPVVEMLRHIQQHGWPIECDIELEYTIPEGSDAVKEVTKCVEYCKKALQ